MKLISSQSGARVLFVLDRQNNWVYGYALSSCIRHKDEENPNFGFGRLWQLSLSVCCRAHLSLSNMPAKICFLDKEHCSFPQKGWKLMILVNTALERLGFVVRLEESGSDLLSKCFYPRVWNQGLWVSDIQTWLVLEINLDYMRPVLQQQWLFRELCSSLKQQRSSQFFPIVKPNSFI